jgi:DNA polymerase-4
VLNSLAKQNMQARTLTVKIKYADFQQITRAHTVEHRLELASLKQLIPLLLARTEAGQKPVRLVGLSLSGFDYPQAEKRQAQLDLILSDVF